MTWDDVCAAALKLPGVELGSYHGYPALRVSGKFLARLGDDGASVEFKAVGLDEREMMIAGAPKVFFVPDGFHGRGVFARLKTLTKRDLAGLLEKRWRLIASKAAVKVWDNSRA